MTRACPDSKDGKARVEQALQDIIDMLKVAAKGVDLDHLSKALL